MACERLEDRWLLAASINTLHSFFLGNQGIPTGLAASASMLYGTTENRGTDSVGTIFSVTLDGTDYQTLHSFSGSDGQLPKATLTLVGSTLYGTTSSGGSGGEGTIFSINTDGTGFQTLYSFSGSDGANPVAALTLDGSTLYGTTEYGGSNNNGTIFSISTDGTGFQTMYSFSAVGSSSDGANPAAALTLDGSTLYGTAYYGGSGGDGTIFSISTDGTGYQTLHSFSGKYGGDGQNPAAALTLDGFSLYGTTAVGGSSNEGTVFSIGTFGSGFETLYSFSGGDLGVFYDAGPETPLTLTGSTLYGTTYGDGFSEGTIFSIKTDGTGYQQLYKSAATESGLTLIGSKFYGTDDDGGTNNVGEIFSINTAGTSFQTLYSYAATDGQQPEASLTLDGSTLYGTTADGGSNNVGTIFAVNTDGTGYRVLYSFSNSSGDYPATALTLVGSKLFGTTQSGGSNGDGTIFSIDPDGSDFQTLYSFSGSDGNQPDPAALTVGNVFTAISGTLYGTTEYGGSDGDGTIFSISTLGTGFQTLYSFSGSDGANPAAALTLGSSMLYGTTENGGTSSDGTIFSISTDGTGFQTLYSFSGSDGETPAAALTLDGSMLYGATTNGGPAGAGTIFSINTAGTDFQTLYSSAGAGTAAALALAGSTLYGTTRGGQAGVGTIFSISTAGTDYQTLYSFSGSDGEAPAALTVVGSTLYGTTRAGVSDSDGTVFELTGLNVSSPAVITNPTSQAITAGQSVTFAAAASGNPAPTVQWQVSTDGGTTFTNVTGATSASYSFTTTAGETGNEYQAVFTNPQGNFATTAATLTVSTAGQPADPGFETDNVGAGSWQYAPSGSGWTFTGTAGVSGNGSAITGGNPSAPQGNQVAFIQMLGSISQSVTISAGSYLLDFDAAQRENYNHGGQSLQVLVDGTVEGTITPAGSNYAQYATAMFTITAGAHTITITGLNPHGGDNTALIDDVSLQPATANAITDPDFAAVSVGAGLWQYAPSGSPWTFSGTAGVSGNGSPITGGNPSAPAGAQVGFVQGTGSISQAVSLSAGSYTLDFQAAQRENYNHGGQTLEVLVDGTAVFGSITPTGTNYTAYGTASFTVAAGTHIITIAGLNPLDGDNTALVDNVSVVVQPNLPTQFADPDFSVATVGAGLWQYAPSSSPWFFSGTAGVSGNGSAITSGNPSAPADAQVGFVQGTGSITQTLSLSAGTYTLEFAAAQRANDNSGGQTLQVLVDGAAVGTITPAGSNYGLYAVTFTTIAGQHRITIAGLNPQGGSNTALLDNVSLQTNLPTQLVDPDFSAVGVGAGGWQYAPSGSLWFFSGTAGVSGNGSAITGGNPNAPQGTQVGFVQDTGSIGQTLSLAAGTYTLELVAAQRGNYNHGGQTLQVSVDGTPVGTITPADSNYGLYVATFTAAAGPHTITIAGTNPQGGDNTALVDIVSLQTNLPTQFVDPDFSAVSAGTGGWQYAPSGSPWFFSGTAGVSGNGSAITGGNPSSPAGTQVGFVQGTGSISQAVSLSAGSYSISFSAAQRGNYNHGGQTLEVLVDGTAVPGNITPTGSNYSTYSTASFTVAAGPHIITIVGLNPQGGDNTALVDNVSAAAPQSNLPTQFDDPDFGAVTVGAGLWQYAPSGSPWTFSGTAGVSGNGSAITGGNPSSPAGTQVGFLQGTGSIEQTLNLSAGTYTLELVAAQRGNYNHGGQTLQVSVDGTPAGTITPAGSNYGLYVVTFTAAAGPHTITIAGTNPQGGDNTALVDNVSLQTNLPTQLVDPDFSAVSAGAGGWQYAPSGSPWFFSGTAGVSGNGSAITGGNPSSPAGTQVGFAQGTGSIEQILNLSAGTNTLELVAAQRGNYNHGGQTLQVSVDGAAVGTITPASSNYGLYAVTFTAAAGPHTITIAGTNPQGGDNTALVDNVSLQTNLPTQFVDPDFSAVSAGAGGWQYAPSGSSWFFSGTAGVSGNGSAITGGNPNAPQGTQVGFVQGTGSIEQILNLSAGTYTLELVAAQRGNYNHGGQTLEVLVDGTPAGGGITPADAAYTGYTSISFTVSTGIHVITIQGLNPQGGDNTALIDQVMLSLA